jgi:ASC-1-like (ASCH) protein
MKHVSSYLVILLVVLVVLLIIGGSILASLHYNKQKSQAAVRAEILGGGPFRLKVSDPEYTSLLEGKKTIEARLDRPPFNHLVAGDPLVVIRSRPKGDDSEYPGGRYKYDAEVVRVEKYKGIEALLKGEGVGKVYPGKSAADAAARFGMYLPPGTPALAPVIAIEIRASSGSKNKAAKKRAERLGAKHKALTFGRYGSRTNIYGSSYDEDEGEGVEDATPTTNIYGSSIGSDEGEQWD